MARSFETPPIFRLPLELRQLIYTYLLPIEDISHPLPSVGITSVSRRPPSTALLNIHPKLTSEILSHFYSLATWKLVFSHSFNFFSVDPDLRRLEQSPSLQCIRNIEVVFFCDILLWREYPSFGMDKFAIEIEKRAARACEVLAQAENLRKVVVSWVDTTDLGMWEHRARVLGTLKVLNQREGAERNVSFSIGEVNGPQNLDRKVFGQGLHEVLGPGTTVDQSMDSSGRGDRPEKYRMLAFDVRQKRGQYYSSPGSLPIMHVRRSGWSGAPAVLASPIEEGQDEI